MKTGQPPAKRPCQLLNAHGVMCERETQEVLTRGDGTTLDLCSRHAGYIRAWHHEHPGVFAPVEWTLV